MIWGKSGLYNDFNSHIFITVENGKSFLLVPLTLLVSVLFGPKLLSDRKEIVIFQWIPKTIEDKSYVNEVKTWNFTKYWVNEIIKAIISEVLFSCSKIPLIQSADADLRDTLLLLTSAQWWQDFSHLSWQLSFKCLITL